MTCETLLGVLLQPYWLILLTYIANILLSVLVKVILKIYKGEFFNEIKNKEKYMYFLAELVTPSLVVLFPQSILQYIHFVYSIYLAGSNNEWQNGWEKYQVIGTVLMNSGLLNSLTQSWWMFLFNDLLSTEKGVTFPLRIKYLGRFTMFTQIFIIFVFFMTHSVPALFIYIWIVVLVLIPTFCLLMGVAFCGGGVDENATSISSLILNRVLTWTVVVIISTGFNYMVLFYQGYSYLDVIRKEWMLRNTVCYVNDVLTNAQHKFALVTYIL